MSESKSPFLGNVAKHRYVLKKDPTVEMFYLEVSDGWMQRFNAAGIVEFAKDCRRDGRTFKIVDPQKIHVRDKVL